MPNLIQLNLSTLTTRVDGLVADDVIFAEVAADLNFDEGHRNFAGVLHAVLGAEGDVDGLVLADELDIVINLGFSGAFYKNPMFGAVVM